MGKCPSWPESLPSARVRYAKRFLDHLRRARHIKKSCLLVTHGHMVQVWKDVEVISSDGRGGFIKEKKTSALGNFCAPKDKLDSGRCPFQKGFWMVFV